MIQHSKRSLLRHRWRYIALSVLICLAIVIGQPARALESALPTPTAVTQRSTPTIDQGRELYAAGRFSEAATVWQAAAEAYDIGGDRPNQALSLSYLSIAYQELSQWENAEQAIDQSLSILQVDNPDPILLAHALNTQAGLRLHSGQTETALETWQRGQRLYEQAGDTLGALGSQVNQAQALQKLGFYRRSGQQLEAVNQRLAALPDSEIKVTGLRNLGIALQVTGDLEGSREALFQSAEIARQIGATIELSATYSSLGATAAEWGDPDAALIFYEEAEQAALNASELVQAQLGQLRLYLDHDQPAAAVALAPSLYQQLTALSPSRTSVYDTVNFIASLAKLEARSGQPIPIRAQGELLAKAVQAARSLKDPQAESHALSQWGALYTRTNQWQEALDLTDQSLRIARTHQSDDIVAQSAWQLGRLLKQQGQKQEAIAAYREAVGALKALRGDLVAINSNVQFSYRESVEPVYRELVDLLLQGDPSQSSLIEAREMIEALQVAELDNFFREACLDVAAQQIDQVDPKATIIYPIILPDRLAVIQSSLGQPLHYHTTPITSAAVEETLRQMLTSLHPASDNAQQRRLSEQVYDWLIRPAKAFLGSTETLVFVPDGLLRNVPMAALYDGEHYLVEDYAVALSPGLQLMSAQSLSEIKTETVVGGISAARNGFSALPAVETEVTAIGELAAAKPLLNDQFTTEALTRAINDSSANVVHLATHGQFSSRLEDTFLLTWEGRLNVQDLSELLKSRDSQRGAVELLVLSACDTAAGDDRAVLGLAGLAVKSGARATVATLWPVKDRAAAMLMDAFYQHLQDPEVTKAEALRRAQLTLIDNPVYSDPFFWSAYTLVGNWL